MQLNIGVIFVMLRNLNAVVDKVIVWQVDGLLCPERKINVLGSVKLAWVSVNTHHI